MARWLTSLICLGLSVNQRTFGFFWDQGALPSGSTSDDVEAEGNLTNNTTTDKAETGIPRGDRFEWWTFSTFWGYGRWSGARSEPFQSGGDGDGRWFSTPESPGRLSEEGGWAWYFVDGAGVYLCGPWWPLTAWAIVGILTYSLQQLLAPVRWLGRCLVWISSLCPCCCRRKDEALAFLPSVPEAPTTVEWRGPGTGWLTETRYLEEKVKGRGSRRRLNDGE